MKYKFHLCLLIIICGSFVWLQPVSAVEDQSHWKKNCRIDPADERNLIEIDGERYLQNVDQKVYWEVANDFCVSLDLLVAYNFVLVPREPKQFSLIKIPPGPEEIGWIPGQSEFVLPEAWYEHGGEPLLGPTAPDEFGWPANEDDVMVSQLYHESHHGLDLAGKIGTPIIAIANGKVIRVDYDHHIFGKLVVIDHGNDVMGVYAHLSEIDVLKNDYVEKGELIGGLGNTGRSSAPHLHLEIRESFRYVDPCVYVLGCPDGAFHGPRYQDITLTAEERAQPEPTPTLDVVVGEGDEEAGTLNGSPPSLDTEDTDEDAKSGE
ncbi:MAG: M23 family metallopeptidase [Chloroflexota bacterium]